MKFLNYDSAKGFGARRFRLFHGHSGRLLGVHWQCGSRCHTWLFRLER
jgi:hypothetical protein